MGTITHTEQGQCQLPGNFVEARQGIRVILHKEGLVIYSTVLNCQYDGYPVTTLEADDGQ